MGRMAAIGFGTDLAPTPALPRKREREHVSVADMNGTDLRLKDGAVLERLKKVHTRNGVLSVPPLP